MAEDPPTTPHWQQQHCAVVPPNPGMPEMGRDALDRGHAVFTIIETLHSLGLGGWTTRLLQWLGRFDGFEMHIPDEADPLLCVRQILLGHAASRMAAGLAPQELMQHIASDLCSLEFVHYRGYWSCQPPKVRLLWKPLELPWFEFIKLGQVREELCTWRPERGNPEFACEFRQWLLQ